MPQRFRTRDLTRDVAAVVLGLGLTAVAVAPALATEVAGEVDAMSATDAGQDPRAEVHDGNAVDCEDFGGGILVKVGDDEKIENVALTYEGGVPGQDQYLTITEVPSGIDVTAIVVKGGDGYNVYVPGARDLLETVPWADLRAPLNNGGNIPAISHWYACGAEKPSATPTSEPTNPNPGEPEPSQTPGEESPSGEPTEAPPSSGAGAPATSTPSGGGASVPETTESAPAPVAEDDDLASTGFSGGWLIGLGAALVAGGGALLAVTRLRKGKTTS
ncbi:hypothetical protein [Saccharomonospora xinjiangensis]|uniref:Gram-positive cocci surface proteins LPxTG domain-containing protein n=1 Tax=Saccharomonospora xinjiangensis XJ-54 TaxID=882086 RepID=I0V563_9PSEU|nr:hypothetical protein [Saccharomonospora xinjiangensis]EID55266.1 hypothetical protein SacxiDRAFT_3056 [Saccharomonospora xinjiangensis XJ-54]